MEQKANTMTPSMNAHGTSHIRLSENIIVADADYIDYVAFQLSVQFERMLNRRVPPADLSRWAVNVALDGGLRAKEGVKHETQVVLVHDKGRAKLDNFMPSNYDDELNAKAFEDPTLGEFLVNAYAVGDVVGKDDYILDTVRMVTEHSEVKRLMVIPNGEEGDLYAKLRHALRDVDNDQHITLFAMQPMEGGNFRQEILGYSLMNALGIRAEEIK